LAAGFAFAIAASLCYAACAIDRVSPDEGVRPIRGCLAALLLGLAVVAAIPWLSTGFLDK
jgi:hypothetical protein